MRIIRYGHVKPLFASCSKCGALLEFTDKDISMTNMHLAKGPQDNGRDYYISCPVCGKHVFDESFKETLEDTV